MKTLLTILLATATLAQAEDKKPNIVMILMDDLGRQDLSYNGSTFYETPAIDALAEQGMVFENAYCSHPRCGPSRYSIMSGRIPSRDGVPGYEDRSSQPHFPLPLARVTFGERLKEAGYSTGFIGKWHLGGDEGAPSGQGFDDSRIAGEAGAPVSYFYPYHLKEGGKEGGKEKFPEVPGEPGEYLTDRLTNEAVDFIEKNKEKPFLLVLSHYAVHTPFQAPEELIQKYRKKLRKADQEVGGKKDDADLKGSDASFDKTVQNNPTYAAMVDSMDQSVARVIAELDKQGLSENTLIIFTSDHGGLSTRGETNGRSLATSNLPYRHGKGWLYDGGLRVPMIVKWPGHVTAGSRTTSQTLGADHYATIVEAAGLENDTTEAMDSISYLPVLAGENKDRGEMFFHSPQSRPFSTGDQDASALIIGNWKIFKHIDSGEIELYDLEKDPGESTNLATELPEKTAQMKAELERIATVTNARQGGRNPFKDPKRNKSK